MSFPNILTKYLATKPTVHANAQGYLTGMVHADGVYTESHLTLTNLPISITDALAYGSVGIITFPEGILSVKDCILIGGVFTTHTAISTTLNSGVTVQYGLGSAAASATTLATTMINLAPGTGQTVPSYTSSTVIDTAPAAVNSYLLADCKLDGHTTAITMYMNQAVATGTDIDGDATVLFSGDIYITWKVAGDY